MHKVVTDKNGRMRTEDVVPPPSAEALEKLRREVRDIVAGNVQFHTDPLAAPKPAIEDDLDYAGLLREAQGHSYLEGFCNCLAAGGYCDECVPAGGRLYHHLTGHVYA